jgi:hypothetical protein
MWMIYQAKAVERTAIRIEDKNLITQIDKDTYEYLSPVAGKIKFKAHQEPDSGDYIVRLTEDDTYHCSDAVFNERNVIESARPV